MAVELVNSQITFGNSQVSRQSVEVIMFAARHNYFKERTRSYSSTTELIADGIPSSSTIYKALQGAFAQTPAPSFIKVGRLETASLITPVDAVDGKIYGFTVQAEDATSSYEVSVTAGVAETQEDIVTAMKAALDAQTEIAAKVTSTVVGTGANAVLQLSHAVTGSWFTVSAFVNVTESFPSVPEVAPADDLAAITLEDDDFYWITTDVKDAAYVQQLGAEMASRFGIYAVALDEQDALTSSMSGTFKTFLVDEQYSNVYPIYHHQAKTDFPELAEVAEAATLTDQGITFANRQVIGVPPSAKLDGKNLSTTETNNLIANEINFFAKTKIAGSARAQQTNPNITYGGKVANGELALNIVGRDALRIDMEAALTNLLISQKTGRLSWDDDSLEAVYSTVDRVLRKYADKDGWNLIFGQNSDFPYQIYVPRASEVNPLDKADNILRQCRFVAYLKGAIHMVQITGTLA